MSSIFSRLGKGSYLVIVSTLTFIPFPSIVQAQALEEVVVTAQRREQSLQEVPISIHAVSGLELNEQGFRTMEDLGQFSPSVEMNESLHEQSVTIRGMGNDVAAMSVEQSAPIFVDGVHVGRPSMIKGAFMDVERIEVLTGPQPVYFGQNATAGAFSITTRRPSDTWQADATAEFGNFGRVNFEGGVGGPISDTLGIRLAGQWDHTGGHLTDVFTGNTFPNRTDSGGRATFVWKPNERYTGTAKFEYMRRRSDGDTNTVCLSQARDNIPHNNFTVMIPGAIPEFTDEIVEPPRCGDGFSKIGVQEGTGVFPAPIHGINNDDARSGLLDIRDISREIMPDGNLTSREPLDAFNMRLSGLYEFDNGLSMEGVFGMVNYDRDTFESTDESPYLMEAAFRTEKFDMYSGEVRLSSPTGGQMEWSAGIYYQAEALDMDPVRTNRAEIRQPLRIHHPYQDSEWKSAFATFTFNFLDNKASLDLGGRFSDVDKQGGITAQYATWIFDIDPDPNGDGIIESTEHRRDGDRVRNDVAEAIIDCGTLMTVDGGTPDGDMLNRPVAAKQCGSYGAGFWTHEWRETDIPDAWDTRSPIDISQPIWGLDRTSGTSNGPFQDTYGDSSFDPQITLRYRPNANHSLYAKWAKAFKAGGFDTSDRGISRGGLFFPDPRNFRVADRGDDPNAFDEDGQKEFQYERERATVYEIGSKGNLFDGRVRYAATLFYQKIVDLQVETEIADFNAIAAGAPATGRYLTNAAAQRNQGLEFDIGWAATDRLTYNLAGVIQDSIMLDFIGGCTEFEAKTADTGPCWTAEESIDLIGSDALEGNIDRTGEKAPRAPDWKFILDINYERPILDRYTYKFNSRMAISDEYTQDTLGFTRVIQWPVHADWNMLVGIGDANGTWDINLFARNILGARQAYFPEYDDEMPGIMTDDMPQSAWFNYGIQFNYHYR